MCLYSCLNVYVYYVYFVYDFLNNNNRPFVLKKKLKRGHLCSAFSFELTSKVLRMVRINEGSQFYLPSTRLSTNGMSHSAFTPQLWLCVSQYSYLVSKHQLRVFVSELKTLNRWSNEL